MRTQTMRFDDIGIGEQFIADYGEHGQLCAGFVKTAHNHAVALTGAWPMPFLHDEKVQIAIPEQM